MRTRQSKEPVIVYFLTAVTLVSVYILLSPRFAQWAYKGFLFHTKRSIGNLEEFNSLLERRGGYFHSFIGSTGNTLRCAYIGAEENPLLMYNFGKDGDIPKRAEIIELILDAGYRVFIYEYSGYGKSEGKPSLEQMRQDALDAFDFLVEDQKVKAQDVTLFGESMGGLNATHVLRERNVEAIILKSAFASLAKAAKDKMLIMRIFPNCLFPKADNVANLKFHNGSTLVIHGAGDRMISGRHLNILVKACSGRAIGVRLPDSRHSFMSDGDKETFTRSLSRFREGT